MAFPYVGAGGSSGVNLNDVWPASSARLQIMGFRRGSTIIGVDGYSYDLTLTNSAIPAGTAGYPPTGVPAGYLYWRRDLDLKAGGASSNLRIAGTPSNGTVGSGNTFTPTVTGGTAPYTLSLASGTLPPGRTVNGSAGTVTGSYTTAGSYNYVLRVTDAAGATADLNVSVTVGASKRLGQVATSGLIPDNKNTSAQQMMARTPHKACDTISDLQLVFGNFLVPAPPNNTETALGTASATIRVSIEYPAGTYTPVLFSGSANGTIAPKSLVTSDKTTVSIPDGADFWVRTWWNCADGIPYCSVPNFGNQLAFGTTTPDLTAGGTIAAQASAGYGPLAILSQTAEESLALPGDSIEAGLGATPTAGINRGIIASSLYGIPYINLGVGGDRVQAAIGTGAYTLRSQLASYCTKVVCNYGFNDLVGYNRAPAAVHADLQTFYGLPGIAGKPIWQTTITPKSTSTDGFVTETNQTVDADNADRVTFNTTLRNGVATIAGVIDVASVLESTTTSGKWQAPSGQALVGDGVHPNSRAEGIVVASGIVSAKVGIAPGVLVTVPANGIIVADGDSITAGQQAAGATNQGPLQAVQAWPYKFADLVRASGVAVSADNWFGDHGSWGNAQTAAGYAAGDGRVTFAGSAGLGSNKVAGGNCFAMASAGAIAFASARPCVGFEVYWRDGASGRNWSYSVDGGGEVAVNSTGTTQLSKVTIPAGSLGTHTLRATWVSGNVDIYAVVAIEAASSLRVWNWAISGATSAVNIDNVGSPVTRYASSGFYKPDLSILTAGPNDWRNTGPITVATFKANFKTRVQLALGGKTGAQALIWTPIHDPSTTGSSADQELYVQAMREVAAELGVPILDIRSLWRSHAYAVSQGWAVQGDVHPTTLGYVQIAQWLRAAVNVTVAV